jgi:hypothetical protein
LAPKFPDFESRIFNFSAKTTESMATQPGDVATSSVLGPGTNDNGDHAEPQHQTLMGHQALDQARVDAADNPDTHLINRGLDDDDLHSPFTVSSLIVNRTIASGIFTQPYNVVTGVGNPGASLVIWFVAGVIIQCITACWVELGLSVPRYRLFNGVDSISTPRSGGDKNYVCITRQLSCPPTPLPRLNE